MTWDIAKYNANILIHLQGQGVKNCNLMIAKTIMQDLLKDM